MNWEDAWAHLTGSLIVAVLAYTMVRHPQWYARAGGGRLDRVWWKLRGVDDPDSTEGYSLVFQYGLVFALIAAAVFVYALVELSLLALHRV